MFGFIKKLFNKSIKVKMVYTVVYEYFDNGELDFDVQKDVLLYSTFKSYSNAHLFQKYILDIARNMYPDCVYSFIVNTDNVTVTKADKKTVIVTTSIITHPESTIVDIKNSYIKEKSKRNNRIK